MLFSENIKSEDNFLVKLDKKSNKLFYLDKDRKLFYSL